jgi:site-specific DNA-methyltransferase (adenine-specific)
MGAEWDKFVPPPGVWDEVYRVLKPGAYLLAFCAPRTYDLMGLSIRLAGFEIQDSIDWIFGQGMPKSRGRLKPAHEPVIVAWKPTSRATEFPGLDRCRVETSDSLSGGAAMKGSASHAARVAANVAHAEEFGRWPPNVVLSEEAAEELDRQSGVLTSGTGAVKRASAKGGARSASIGAESRPEGTPMLSYGDTGGASRFFPVFHYQAKATQAERPRLADGTTWGTIKPLDFMRWLVRLVTPLGGTVLEPFAGTFTTAEACIVEGFPCIAIDRDETALRLGMERLSKPIQPLMFGMEDSAPAAPARPVAASRPRPAPEVHPSLFDLEAS